MANTGLIPERQLLRILPDFAACSFPGYGRAGTEFSERLAPPAARRSHQPGRSPAPKRPLPKPRGSASYPLPPPPPRPGVLSPLGGGGLPDAERAQRGGWLQPGMSRRGY